MFTGHQLKITVQVAVYEFAPGNLLDRANRGWKDRDPGKIFGETYADASPWVWEKMNMVYNTINIMGKYVIPAMQALE